MSMLALSLWAQWAEAVKRGKPIENRPSWGESTPALAVARRTIGQRFVIHAALYCGTRREFSRSIQDLVELGVSVEGMATPGGMGSRSWPAGLPVWKPAEELQRGALVALVTLAGVILTLPGGHRIAFDRPLREADRELACLLCGAMVCRAGERCAKADPWALTGVGLLLGSAVALPVPVTCKGAQGFFKWERPSDEYGDGDVAARDAEAAESSVSTASAEACRCGGPFVLVGGRRDPGPRGGRGIFGHLATGGE